MIKFVSEDDNRLLITIYKDINFETARDLEYEVKNFEIPEKVTFVKLDLSNVRFIDSTGVSLMIKWLFPLSKQYKISINGASEPLKNILRISKIDQIITVN